MRRIASTGPVCPSAIRHPWDGRFLFLLKLVEEPGAAEVYLWRNRGQWRYVQRPTVEIPRRRSLGDPGGRVEEEEGKGRRAPSSAQRRHPQGQMVGAAWRVHGAARGRIGLRPG